MGSEVYDALNRAWKSTCRVVLGEEVGELDDFRDWLMGYVEQTRVEKSAVDEREVHLAIKSYCRGARFIGFDQISIGRKFEPLTINEIKDIDSLVESLRERFYYTGNVILGNSRHVEGSGNIVDSSYIYNSVTVSDSKYIGYCDTVKAQEYSFGLYGDAESSHTIKCTEGYSNRRNFECHATYLSSDCYFVANAQNCRDCMFSFGIRGKAHSVGNSEIPKEKYLELKSKLLGEIAGKLKKDKRFFSLLEVIERADGFPAETRLANYLEEPAGDRGAAEKAFSTATSVVLGKELYGMDNYARLLQKHVPYAEVIEAKSKLTGRKVAMAGYYARFLSMHGIRGRLVSEDEIKQVGEKKVDTSGLWKRPLDADSVSKVLHPIAYVAFETSAGNNMNMVDCAIITNSEDCYKGTAYVYSKRCGYSFWPRHSEYIFGSGVVWNSAFCIKSHYSKKLSRAFEVDSCENSSDLYFSHNCENVREGLFCFNAKNLSYAVGNSPLAPGEYRELKKSLLEQVVGEIEARKELKWDVYNIGCARRL